LVLPIALDLGVKIALRERADDVVHLVTDADLQPQEVSYSRRDVATKDGSWADRVRGLTEELRARGAEVTGFDAVVSATLPPGAEFDAACQHLGIASLGELETRSEIEILDRLPPPLDRRVRHVLSENARVRAAVTALRAANMGQLGELLRASHRSLRDDYEVSTAELDRLVAIADDDPDVLGARLVGGGFGGSVLALTTAGHARDAGGRIVTRYGAGDL